jgi:glycosyltransferase involved in cell wall biosynthesis
MNYSIITPARNESDHIEKTIRSVVNQKILPDEWIILDDHSDDGMADVIEKLTPEHPFIRVIPANPRIPKDYSSRVVELFSYGYANLNKIPDIVVKLDADVAFEPDFFSRILNEFHKRPKLGIASGHLTIHGIPEPMKYGKTGTRGATKCYRISCLKSIGGIVPAISWDTVDNAAARAKGWETETLPIYFEHLKKEGSRAGSYLKNHFRTGFSNGSIPYYFPYFLMKILIHVIDRPVLLGSIVQFAGYVTSRFLKKNRPFPDFATHQVMKEQKAFIKSLIS